jgi:hypothetical protein
MTILLWVLFSIPVLGILCIAWWLTGIPKDSKKDEEPSDLYNDPSGW